jgi:hypothetical protein
MGLGQFRGAVLVDGYTSKLPQSDLNLYARRVLSQWISITDGCDEEITLNSGVVRTPTHSQANLWAVRWLEIAKSKPPPCRRKRDEDGAPVGVEMSAADMFAFHSPYGILRGSAPELCSAGQPRAAVPTCDVEMRGGRAAKEIYFRTGFPVVLLIRPQAEKDYDATHSLKHRGYSGNQHRAFAG